MSCSEACNKTSDAMRESMMYRTFARIFESGFGAPLYFKAGATADSARHPACEAAFCIGVNPAGNCVHCSYNRLPKPEQLAPWTWTLPCAAGLRVTMVPIQNGEAETVGWLVSGHVLVDGDGKASLAEGDDPRYKDVLRLTADRHDLLVSYLETCAGILGANANGILVGHGRPSSEIGAKSFADISSGGLDRITDLTGLEPRRYMAICDLERARNRFLRCKGEIGEILNVARAAGWLNGSDFTNAFQSCFGETPDEHLRKTVRLWREFSRTVARI